MLGLGQRGRQRGRRLTPRLQALPILQEDLINQRQVLAYADFAAAVAIGRITPGPNGLFVITVGYPKVLIGP